MYKAAAIRGLCFLFTLFCVYGFVFFPDKNSGRYRGSKGVIFSGTPENEYKKQGVFPGTLFPGVKPEETAIPAASDLVLDVNFAQSNYSGGVFADASGYGHDGTPNSAPSFVSDQDSGANGAVDLSSNLISFGAVSEVEFQASDSFSFSIWIKYGLLEPHYVVRRYSPGYMVFRLIGNNIEFYFRDASANIQIVRGDTTLSTGTWYHLAVTYQGGGGVTGVKIYLNGAEDTPYWGSPNNSLDSITYTTDLILWGLSNPEISRLRIWKKALSGAEVLADYNE